jgi:hypothetical protein
MYLSLKTENVYEVVTSSPVGFFENLDILLCDGDILSFGCYAPSSQVVESLSSMSVELEKNDEPYSHNFELNRDEYPDGRAYNVKFNKANLANLSKLCELPDGGTGKQLFFDHFVSFRRAKPVVPLINFHDAFVMGGDLLISGLYEDSVVRKFSKALGVSFRYRLNPEVIAGRSET